MLARECCSGAATVSALVNTAVGLAICVGLVGVVVPALPGALLVAVAIVVWAVVESSWVGWAACGMAGAVLGASQILKYVVPGRRMRDSGVPNSSVFVGGIAGIVGFFVIPVLGLLVGFVGGVYLAELRRLHIVGRAWPSTKVALRAVGLSMLIELAGALLATGTWIGAVWLLAAA